MNTNKTLKNYLNNPLQKFAARDRRRAEGRRRRAQSRGPEAHWGERGAGGDVGSGRAMSRDGENDSFAFGASLLGFIELGPYMILSPCHNKYSFLHPNFVPQRM
jgi:hypothetical protein